MVSYVRRWAYLPALVMAVAALISCGGGSSTNPVQGASPAGIWRGTDSASGLTIVAMIDETGNAALIRSDSTLFVGQVSTMGDSISVMLDGYAPQFPFPDGSGHGVGMISGTIQERQSISANIQFTTDAGTSTHGTLDLTFDPLYNRPSSLATVAGGFTEVTGIPLTPPSGPIVFVDASGVMTETAPMGQFSGNISIINPDYNLYQVQLKFTFHGMPAGSWSGLATLDNTFTPERLVIGVSGGNSAYLAEWPRAQ